MPVHVALTKRALLWRERPWSLVLLAAVVVGALLRFWRLDAAPMWIDETITAFTAEAVLRQGAPVFASGAGSGYGLLHVYEVAGVTALFGSSAAACRGLGAAFGVAAIVATYLLGKEVRGPAAGAVAAALAAVLSVEVVWARQCRMYPQLQLFYVLGLWMYLLWLRRPSSARLATLAATAVLIVFLHPFGYALAAVCAAHYVVVRIAGWRHQAAPSLRRLSILVLLVPLALFAAVLLWLSTFTFDLAGPAQVLRRIAQTEVDYASFYIHKTGAALGAVGVVAILGWALLVSRRRLVEAGLLAAAVVVPFYVVAFHVPFQAVRYAYMFLPVLVVGAAVGIVEIGHSAAALLGGGTSRPAVTLAILLMLGVVAQATTPGVFLTDLDDADRLSDDAPRPSFDRAYAHVAREGAPTDAIVSTWTTAAMVYAGRSDAWVGFDVQGVGLRDWVTPEGRELYTDNPIIWTAEDAEVLLSEKPRAWAVFHDASWRRLDPPLRHYFEQQWTYEPEGSDSTIHVFSYGLDRL